MKASVLVVADPAGAPAICAALADFGVTLTDEVTRALALASTGAFLAVYCARGARASGDAVGALAYDEFVELTRYALTRRYLAGTPRQARRVSPTRRAARTSSARACKRRFHVSADDFRGP